MSLSSRTPVWIFCLLIALVIACGEAQPPPTGEQPEPTEEEPDLTRKSPPSPTTTEIPVDQRAILYGADAGDRVGALVAGDFNGDGAADVALAAALADGPQNLRPDAGEVYVFFGPLRPGDARDAFLGQQDVTIYGAGENDQAGRALAAGDLNGDGFDDLLLSALYADGPKESREDAGEAYVILGAAALPPVIDLAASQQDVTIFGADAGDIAGNALGTADINGDGLDDVIMSAFRADGPSNTRAHAGEAYLVFGSQTPPSTIDLAAGEQDLTVFGADADDRLGESVEAGDLNGDGVFDLILPAAFADGPASSRDAAGETYVILGSDSLAGTIDIAQGEQDMTIFGIDPGDQLGHSLASGDVNGDGFADLLLGALSADGPKNARDLAGEAYLLLGSDLLPVSVDTATGEMAALIYGAEAVDRLGRSIAIGDLNGDGLDDLILASPGRGGPGGGRPKAGALSVLLAAGSLPKVTDLAMVDADMTVRGENANDILGHESFGQPPLLAIDMNGDGLDDILITLPGGDGPSEDRQDAGEGIILFSQPPP